MAGIQLIPKKIHYCWFGGKEKPEIIKNCMRSWHENLPGYEIIEWNESNFDIHCNQYIREAYYSKCFAFVSDYVRVHALYNWGGVYLDTDVEVFKSFDDLLYHDSFWGFEQENYIATSTIGAAKGNKLIKVFLDSYEEKCFIKEDGSYATQTNVAIITEILKEAGIKMNGKYQELEGRGAFYPQTYFSPYDYINCRNFITENTYAMHHFYKSWLSPRERVKGQFKKIISKVIGGENIARIRKVVSRNKEEKGEKDINSFF
ncbi:MULTISPECIES: glycosyltransferase family 32 protein [Bacillus]|uniref:Glycosyl transferase n=1 Tax=Bacillus cereus TaxID=1396 RepID=A0A2C1LDA2_BACCE|nr:MULTISPECIES: capsular polysaccharide synthesis protein [Bacillus]PGT96253.1 glycosyl transferase [Bacillus cereus]PGX01836.1 glycosyl transferase [Bacillus sp. AFS033286]